MLIKKSNKLIVIGGHTASGKTQLAIELAKYYKTKIISFDSRQFYKEMSIGTAKPTNAQLNEVKHHFIGHISIHDEYNAGQFENEAIERMDQLFEKYEYVIATGGSGMYLDALLYGLDELPKVKEGVRDKLMQIHREEGLETLRIMLKKSDPEHYNNVDLNNPHRIIRALEIILSTGSTYSELRKGKRKSRNFDPFLFGVDLERDFLYTCINNRVQQMMKAGLLQEVTSLYDNKNLNALQTVGYKELFDHLDGKTDLESAVKLIQQNTRRFAKRQITWFRRYDEMEWLKPMEAFKRISTL